MKRFLKNLHILTLSLIFAKTIYADNSNIVYDTLNRININSSAQFFVKDMNGDGNYEIYVLDNSVHASATSTLITFVNGQAVTKNSAEYSYLGCNPNTGVYVESNGWTGFVTYNINQLNSDGTVTLLHTIHEERGYPSTYEEKANKASDGMFYRSRLDNDDNFYYTSETELTNDIARALESLNLQQSNMYSFTSSNFEKAIIAAGGNLYSQQTTSNSYHITKKAVSVTVGDRNIVVTNRNGYSDYYTMSDSMPYIQTQSSSFMVPLRALGELLTDEFPNVNSDEIVKWNAETKTATVTIGSKTVVATVGSNYIYVDGRTVAISNGASPEIVDGRVYLPFRTVGEAFGVSVNWDAGTRTATFIG